MTEDDYKHFVCIVAGDNPDELMKKYDMKAKTDKYVVYKYSDAELLKKSHIELLAAMLTNNELSSKEIEEIKEYIDIINNENPSDFFNNFTSEYEHDDETGDAISDENPDGKWSYYTIGKIFSIPFVLNDENSTSFQARKGDVYWFKMHHFNTRLYNKVWELCMEGAEPRNDEEKKLWENMHNRTGYLEKFGTKKNYTESCTAFWGYAFLSEKTGWVELEPNVNQFEWMNGYYDRFIEPLDDNTLLTIFECKK